MNYKLFGNHYNLLVNILKSKVSKVDKEEEIFKFKKLKGIYQMMISKNLIDDNFYALSHEIRSLGLFYDNGKTIISKDSKNKIGPDIIYKDRYMIECTICTAGSDNNNKALKDSGFQVYNKIVDYNEKFRQISLRITNSIKVKKDQFEKYIQKKVLSKKDCCIIFINMGPLATEWFPGNFCDEATRFLIGRGFPQITIDTISGKQIGGVSYNFIPEIINNNNSYVNTNIFADKSYSIISAIMISTATLEEDYNYNNSIIFINPFAKNKLRIKDFRNFVYWKANKNYEYVPRSNGKKQKNYD
jgi:hypothetical protein